MARSKGQAHYGPSTEFLTRQCKWRWSY